MSNTYWYRVNYRKIPERVEVERETAKTLIISGRRVSKDSGMDKYYPTHQEAWASIIGRAKRIVDSARRNLNLAMADQRTAHRNKAIFEAEMKK